MPEFSINMTTDLLKDVIYRRIRDMIINGTLPMGCKISESALATRLSSTKAPVRDALRRLQSEGLVHIRPKSGTFVFNLSDIEFNGLLEFRYFVEAKALRLSLHRNQRQLVQALSSYLDHMTFCLENNSTHEYIRLDNLFHEALFTYCGNAIYSNPTCLFLRRWRQSAIILAVMTNICIVLINSMSRLFRLSRMRMPKKRSRRCKNIFFRKKALIGDSSAKKNSNSVKSR